MKNIFLRNASLYFNGAIHQGSLLIKRGKISKIFLNEKVSNIKRFHKLKTFRFEIDCNKRLIIPGLIDVHSHLRDMGQCDKETFLTGTQAAAYNGITTTFNMPNTLPPANNSKQIKLWLRRAKNNLYIDVGFIAGIPNDFDNKEVKKIIKRKIIGFKIYPHRPLGNLDWTDENNINHLFKLSSKYNVPIFIHPEWPLREEDEILLRDQRKNGQGNILELHNQAKSSQSELRYIKFIIENYIKFYKENQKNPIIHLCHISSKISFDYIKEIQEEYKNFRISMETTPHHLLLSKNIQLDQPNMGKVDPPLRDSEDQLYLFDQFKKGNLKIIASDHAPHTIIEKNKEFLDAPSGFPEFDTYPILLLDKVLNGEINIKYF
ncbi:MAG: amidohydrolase family protein, partial [Candidatus Thorarchaeota archaeon]